MEKECGEYEHYFFTKVGQNKINKTLHSELIEIRTFEELLYDPKNYFILRKAEKIIFSGLFSLTAKLISQLLINGLISKTYFQFWGGDFYCYRNNAEKIAEKIRRIIFFYAFKKSAGLIFLIDGEYDRFSNITGISNRHFVAPMPESLMMKFDYVKYMSISKHTDEINILIGNSATESNHHIETFKMLEHLKDCNIRIFCPLSYGDELYRDEVVKCGRRMFGSKFVPVLNFMEKEKYFIFLSEMDIGIFYNDRQQAIANIGCLLMMGKKIFMRTGTSMWDIYLHRGYHIYSAESIQELTFQKFVNISEDERKHNIAIKDINNNTQLAKVAWDNVFLHKLTK